MFNGGCHSLFCVTGVVNLYANPGSGAWGLFLIPTLPHTTTVWSAELDAALSRFQIGAPYPATMPGCDVFIPYSLFPNPYFPFLRPFPFFSSCSIFRCCFRSETSAALSWRVSPSFKLPRARVPSRIRLRRLTE